MANDTDAQLRVSGVTTDSRRVEMGDLFVALRGENFDGHTFVAAAQEAGATAALVDQAAAPAPAAPAVVVDDTTTALGDLAAAVLQDRDITVVGITGSCGKTTAKNMTAAVLGATKAVGATPGNWNNTVGVPLSVFALPDPCDVAVLELATSAAGEIARLSHITRPRVGVITNIAAVHLEGLGTLDGVREAKAELLQGLASDGVLILNADDPSTDNVRARFSGAVRTFGYAEDADLRATGVQMTPNHEARFTVEGAGDFALRLYGRAAIANALVAIAVGQEFGVPALDMADALRGVEPEPMRMEIRDAGGVCVVNDAYNANPASMAEALHIFDNGSFPGRKIAVLGDMLELGAEGEQQHDQLGRRLAETHVELVYLCGAFAETVRAGAIAGGLQAERVYTMASPDEIVQSLEYVLRPGDVVLVKGSRGMRMERVADGLLGGA